MSDCPNSNQSPPPAGTGKRARTPKDSSVAPLAVSADAAAKIVGLSVRKVRDLIADGEIPHSRVGGRVLIRVADLDEFLLRHRVGGAA